MAYIGNTPLNVAFLTDQFSGNGSTVAFTLSVAPANTASILVAVTGVVQDPSTYSVSGTTLTFSQAPPTGTGNISVRYLGIPASGVTTTAYRTVTDSTATGGQTTFTIPSYTVGYLNVYRNGVRLANADFTATSGTTVVLVNAATAGDTITTESFFVSSVLNAIPATASSVQQSYLASGVAGTGPAFSAYILNGGANYSLPSNTYTKIRYDTEFFDTANCFDTTNYRFTPNVAGYYFVTARVFISYSSSAPTRIRIAIYKNGSIQKYSSLTTTSITYENANISCLIYMNGTTDYLEAFSLQGSSSDSVVVQGSSENEFSAYLARGA